jgi:hypothetical protein
LTDVYPDGKSIICNDGIRRMRYRESYVSTELVQRGAIYRLAIDLNAMGMVFNRGHRLRVAISSSNAPRFLPNSNTGAAPRLNDPVKIVAQNTVYFDTARPSHIVLPLVGPDRDADGVYDYFDPAPDNAAAPGAMPDEVTYVHSADTNADRRLNLSEILRVVQLFNFGMYHCDAMASDGFAPGIGAQNCRAHDSDYNPQDFQITLNELLHAVQLFNSKGFAAVPEFTPPFVPADSQYALLSPTEL